MTSCLPAELMRGRLLRMGVGDPNDKPLEDPYLTRGTLFGHLRATDPAHRRDAWNGFQAKYARIIASFARKLGVASSEVDDVVQDVTMQFFQQSQTFEYDPSRGRFRGFLKTVTYRTIRDRYRAKGKSVPIDDLDPADPRIDAHWTEAWDKERLALAVEVVAQLYDRNRTFQAFEQHVLAGEAVEVVAAQLKMSVDAVYKNCQRVKESLREAVKRMEAQDPD